MSIDTGDFIECVDDANTGLITSGRLYVVEEVYAGQLEGCALHGDDCAGFGVTLSGVETGDECFCSERFRPVYRPNSDLFRQVMMPVRANETTIQSPVKEETK